MKVIIYADGGSRGNPGIAGSGTVVYAADGETVLREIVYVVGKKASNNVAEYHGLLRGLEAAVELGADDVDFYMDSRLVVEQMNGRWKIKHPDMKQLGVQAQKLMQQLGRVNLSWVRRNDNKVADALSNEAMDAATAGHAPGVVDRGDDSGDDSDTGDTAAGADEQAVSDTFSDAGAAKISTGSHASWTGATCQPTTLILVRHGQTTYSAEHRYCGHSDIELTETGMQQAEASAAAVAERGEIDLVVSSPLQRCQVTAKKIAEKTGAQVETHDALIEADFGDWEGLTFQQAQDDDAALHDAWITDASLAPPAGESLAQVHRRVREFRKELVAKHPGKTIAVVSHVNPIKSLTRQALNAGPATFSHLFLDLASIGVVKFYDENSPVASAVLSVNETAHLR
ncbi:bifunctional RNase H/acid phosphatase [Corynebacterium accolens]|jgi:ribonuclease H|uniref:Bifunctional RNase H/acid phosphatase n=1 Tax=Corynebacterium accolens TaxID=38284 RepID=A0ABT7FQN5_9CORY|nr:bifunctional RNase H/acid phosphatase [Corynebacterium accolens]MDK4209577.1 bifunctional RNase H/acid phosphatase [Corynebacterium accolens]MDK4247722.1 bifunctional RNase H/acid phosphatase [Corynebacterium accolens]MDK4323930.1 bifunctional RNase H/acid phosphatase [Corynebacterium accolens]MDK8470770.1 bifunctional RNase H/acid phosphatase [Corynebacterium accolens]MDK8616851.1 bifunctional RNase H/acid phosphatase [Corynebacterium accolens]